MARFLKPLVRSGGYYPSRRWTPLVYPGGYTTANGGEEPAPPPIEKTITGNPIHILDALAKPAQALSVKLEPVQDLHGYANPWPAGGGVNLLDPAKCSAVGQGGAYGLTVTHDQATAIWTISGTPTSQNASLAFNFCTYSDFSLSGKGYQIQAFPISGTPIKNLYGFRNEAENRIAIIIDTVANPTVNMTFKVSVAATAQTAWSPYSNICPISGHTDADVTRTGKNLLALIGANTTDVIPTINETTGEVSIADTTAIKWASKPFGYSDVVAEQTYILSATGIKYGRIGGSMNTAYPNAVAGNIPDCTTSGGGITSLVTQSVTARTFTPHFTGRIYWHFCTDTNNGSSHQAFTMTPMIELGSTASDYQPYVGTTYPIPLGQTVYGGALDVTTGKLTVDRAMVDLGAKNWYSSTAAGRTRFRTSITDIERISSPNVRASLLCSNYPTKTANQTYQGITGVSLQQNESDIYIYDPQTESMTTAEFKSAMSGVQLCYKLATPQTYQLTPTEVTLLLGENNIWSDGEITLTYLADGNASDEEALNILLGERYVNNHSEDEPTDREALNIVLGGNER
jgi:hypothetical protein